MTESGAVPAFHVLAKPAGAVCNLDCHYCFYLSKEQLYSDSSFKMGVTLLEEYLAQVIEGQRVPEVVISWQGGEPLLMGLDFYKEAVELALKHRKPGTVIRHTLQTNGTLLSEEWCEFFRDNNFLIGLSLDGPRDLHDTYRVDKGGKPTFDKVMHAVSLLKEYGVEFNILVTVNAANAAYPLRVYRFLRDKVEAQYIQFIPIVERANQAGFPGGAEVTNRSVMAERWGNFLITVFDEWVRRDVGQVFVQMFDVALANRVGEPHGMCIHAETCGTALALEHNGDLYSCDHFVEPAYLLGNIGQKKLVELVSSVQQRKFGLDKRATLPRYCRECEVRYACHGGCPKDRFIRTPEGEPGLNYLCQGYRAFFRHIDRPMQIMAGLLRRNSPPSQIMALLALEEANLADQFAGTGRNAPCPCGSGRKFKHCHGRVTQPA